MSKWGFISRIELKENIQQIALDKVFDIVFNYAPAEGHQDIRIPMLLGMMMFLKDITREIDKEEKKFLESMTGEIGKKEEQNDT